MGKNYKNSLGDTLDNIVGAQGIRTDVSVKLNPTTIPVLILSVMVAVTAGILVAGGIQALVKKK